MIESRQKRFTINRRKIINAIVLLLLAYFVFHSIYGSRGILAYFKLQAELEASHKTLEVLRAERLAIENRTKLLRPGSLDRDMLDEKVRHILGVLAPGEQMMIAPKEDNINKERKDESNSIP